jgi:hypothetical protein
MFGIYSSYLPPNLLAEIFQARFEDIEDLIQIRLAERGRREGREWSAAFSLDVTMGRLAGPPRSSCSSRDAGCPLDGSRAVVHDRPVLTRGPGLSAGQVLEYEAAWMLAGIQSSWSSGMSACQWGHFIPRFSGVEHIP